MSHFTLQDWFEFVRGAVTAERRAAMERHLAEGCLPCREQVEVWERATEAYQGMANVEAPPDAVRVAKAAYVTDRSWEVKATATALARLVFDSLRQPLAAGVRGAEAGNGRRLLFEAGALTVDVLLAAPVAGKTVRVMGQVMDAENPEQSLEFSEVRLEDAEARVAATHTNGLGEFSFEVTASERYRLVLTAPGRTPIEMQVE